MLTNIILVDDISEKAFQDRITSYFKALYNISNDSFNIIHCQDIDLNVKIMNKRISFSSVYDSEKQKDFVKKCMLEIFENSTVVFQSTDKCEWLNDVHNINIYKTKIR